MENATFKETTINDYLPKLYEAFPDVPKKDIRTIVEYGWRLIYIANLFGCDTLIQSNTYNFWFYTGYLTKDSLKHSIYYRKKLLRKFKFIYKRLKPKTDEYYYIALSEDEYQQFYNDTHKKGRKKQVFEFVNKVAFKYLCACKVSYMTKAIIKFKPICDLGFSYYYNKLQCNNPILVRKPLDKCTIKDILVDNNDYELV